MLASFFVAPSFAIDLDQSAATRASQGATVARSIYIVGLPARRVSTTRGFAARHFDAGGVKLTVRPRRDVTELSAFAALAPSTSIQTRQRSAAPGLPTLSAAQAALVLRGATPPTMCFDSESVGAQGKALGILPFRPNPPLPRELPQHPPTSIQPTAAIARKKPGR